MIPAVMANWFRETNRPRKDFGASSALYIGTTILRTLWDNKLLIEDWYNIILLLSYMIIIIIIIDMNAKALACNNNTHTMY